jgi:1-acyl-sn-glycerol-3-phosphate acyltransferase
MPPVSIRRPATVTVWLILSAACLIVSPLFLGFAWAVQALTGSRRPLVLARLIVAYCGYELATLVACGALWLAAGCGLLIGSRRFQLAHWRLLGWYVAGLATSARRTLEIDVAPEIASDVAIALEADRPAIVLSRHAGPGDTLFITDELMSRFRRRPSVVFKEAITIDPSIDILAHRLPQATIDPADRAGSEEQIGQAVARLGPRGALLLFPEGGNFTPERRRSALDRLRRKGRRRSADQAEAMPNVMPPQPSGALAALHARGGADVVFIAHTGLGLAAYPTQLWRDMPIGRTMYVRMWLEPSDRVPDAPEEQVEWLYGWWKRIDAWIESRPSE